MKIEFTKMQGLGNDFVVIDNRDYQFTLEQIIEFTPILCHRKFGIGADGILILNDNPIGDAAFEMIYRNADGSDAGMCGNGARCIALFASLKDYGNEFSFHVHEVIYTAKVDLDKENVSIGFPIKVEVKPKTFDKSLGYYDVFTGTDHVVIPLANKEELNHIELMTLAKEIRNSKDVNPKGTNVNFFWEDKATHEVFLETFERGVEDFTFACGTGALATAITHGAISGEKAGDIQKTIQCAGGDLQVSYTKSNTDFSNLILRGPAQLVYSGITELMNN